VQHVRRDDHRGARRGGLLDGALGAAHRRRIEAGQRLVEDQRPRLVQQSAGDDELLLHAARQLAGKGEVLLGEVVLRQQPGGALLAVRYPVDTREQRHVVPYRQVVEQVRFVGHEGELLARRDGLFDEIVAADADGSGRHRDDAGEAAQRGGLSGAVRSHQPEDLPRADVQRQLVDGGEPLVGLDQLVDLDHGAGLYPLPPPESAFTQRAVRPTRQRTRRATSGSL